MMRTILAALALCLVGLGSTAATAGAQAWLPARGQGTLYLAYSYFNGGDHLFSTDRIDGLTSLGYTAEGTHWFLGDTNAHTFTGTFEYGISERVAATLGLGFVVSRYVGNDPINLDLDDGTYHTSFQDFHAQVRASVADHPLQVTPFIGYNTPTTSYAISGHSAPGDGLNELALGVALGRQWPDLGNGMFGEANVGYGITEQVGDNRLGRLSTDLTLGYFLSDRTSVNAFGTWLTTFGGEDWVSSDPTVPISHGSGSVALDATGSAARYVRLGAGLSFPIVGPLTGSVAALTTVWGQNVDDANYLQFGLSWGLLKGRVASPEISDGE